MFLIGNCTCFDRNFRKAWFFTNSNNSETQVSINLAPEEVGDMDLQFTVRLSIPAAAMSQRVVLGEPNVATVTVPSSRGTYVCIYVFVKSDADKLLYTIYIVLFILPHQ